jgi:hypothetical protein
MTTDAIAVGIADLVGKSLVIKTTDPATAQFRLLELLAPMRSIG